MQHRIDLPHPTLGDLHAGAELCPGGQGPPTGSLDAERTKAQRLESLLPAHAQDLIAELQAWNEQLDRREAELNARQARLEHHERSGRMLVNHRTMAVEERERMLERNAKELKSQAARLAIGNLNL